MQWISLGQQIKGMTSRLQKIDLYDEALCDIWHEVDRWWRKVKMKLMYILKIQDQKACLSHFDYAFKGSTQASMLLAVGWRFKWTTH